MGPRNTPYTVTNAATMTRFTQATGISNVWATNVPGIGIRITQTSAFNYSYTYNHTISANDTFGGVYAIGYARIEWIKTSATVSSGSITPGPVGYTFFNGVRTSTIQLVGNTDIVAPSAPTCSVNASSTQTVNLGNYPSSAFTGTGSMTPPKGFDINFDCSGGTSDQNRTVYLTMTDTTVPSNRTDILNLATNSTAKGVGIRLYRDAGATAVKFGADSATVGNTNQWTAGTVSTGTSSLTVPLQARLIQTGPVQQGSVSAKATFTAAYN
jgi:type 1 fimbria pilin